MKSPNKERYCFRWFYQFHRLYFNTWRIEYWG